MRVCWGSLGHARLRTRLEYVYSVKYCRVHLIFSALGSKETRECACERGLGHRGPRIRVRMASALKEMRA